MAELGSIQVTDVNRGVSPVSRNAELQALNQGLSLAGTLITEGATSELRSNLEEAQQGVVDASTASTSPVVEEFTSPSDSPIIVSFVNSMRRHQALAQQSTRSNLRIRAVMLMQQELQQAKAKYPWLRTELNREASSFMNNSPELTELGLVDAGIQAGGSQKVSQDWLDSIRDHAYGKGDNQLGIDDRITFGTVEFSRVFDRKQNRLLARQGLARDEALLQAKDVKDAREVADLVMRQLNGPEGSLTKFYEVMSDAIMPVHQARIDHAAGIISESQLVAVTAEWDRVGREALILRIEDAKLTARREFNNRLGGNLADESITTALRTELNLQISDLSSIQDALKADNTNVAELVNTLAIVRGSAQMELTPSIRNLNDFMSVVNENLIPFINKIDFTHASDAQNQLIANGLMSEIMKFFPSLVAAELEVAGLTDPQKILDTFDQNRARSITPGGRVTSRNSDEVAMDAIDQLEIVKDIGAHPELQDVEGINSSFFVAAKALQALIDHPDLPQPQKLKLRSYLAADELVVLIKKVGRDTLQVKSYILAVTESYLTKIDPPSDWMADIVELSQTPVTFARLPALSYLDLDDESFQTMLETGVVSWTVNEARVKDSYGERAHIDGTTESTHARSDIKALNQIAKDLEQQVTDYIKAQAHIDWARSFTKLKPEYGVAIGQPLPGFPSIDALIGIIP